MVSSPKPRRSESVPRGSVWRPRRYSSAWRSRRRRGGSLLGIRRSLLCATIFACFGELRHESRAAGALQPRKSGGGGPPVRQLPGELRQRQRAVAEEAVLAIPEGESPSVSGSNLAPL